MSAAYNQGVRLLQQMRRFFKTSCQHNQLFGTVGAGMFASHPGAKRFSSKPFSSKPFSQAFLIGAILAQSFLLLFSLQAVAQTPPPKGGHTYSSQEIVSSGHNFFGSISRELALMVEEASRRWGEPNGYILGQEASGAVVGGVRFGEGVLYTRNAGERKVFWQGPSIGFDFGGDGDRTMMLVYQLPRLSDLFQRFIGIDGSAYIVGGFGMTALTADGIVIVPIRSGIGARLGVNIGYLKFTSDSTWNPF